MTSRDFGLPETAVYARSDGARMHPGPHSPTQKYGEGRMRPLPLDPTVFKPSQLRAARPQVSAIAIVAA